MIDHLCTTRNEILLVIVAIDRTRVKPNAKTWGQTLFSGFGSCGTFHRRELPLCVQFAGASYHVTVHANTD